VDRGTLAELRRATALRHPERRALGHGRAAHESRGRGSHRRGHGVDRRLPRFPGSVAIRGSTMSSSEAAAADGSAAAVDPRRPEHCLFWGTLLWGLLIGVVFSVLQAVMVIVIFAVRNPGFSESDLERLFTVPEADGTVIAYSTFATTILGCAMVAGIAKLKK